MLEIRFTTRDNNAWVDMLFAPILVYNFVDKNSGEIIETVKRFAPQIRIELK